MRTLAVLTVLLLSCSDRQASTVGSLGDAGTQKKAAPDSGQNQEIARVTDASLSLDAKSSEPSTEPPEIGWDIITLTETQTMDAGSPEPESEPLMAPGRLEASPPAKSDAAVDPGYQAPGLVAHLASLESLGLAAEGCIGLVLAVDDCCGDGVAFACSDDSCRCDGDSVRYAAARSLCAVAPATPFRWECQPWL